MAKQAASLLRLTGHSLARCALLPLLLAVAACESSTRLGSMLPGQGGRVVQASPPPPLTPAPSADVDTTTLAPPPGLPTTSLPPPTSGPGATYFPQGTPPSQPLPQPAPSRAGSVASAPGNLPPISEPAPSPVQQPQSAPTRSSVTGNWSLTEGAGTRCRITLSSAPKLDLYGAGTAGCAAKELQRVNAWELSGSEVILYEPGGGVVARLRGAGGSFAGVSTRTGAPISMAK